MTDIDRTPGISAAKAYLAKNPPRTPWLPIVGWVALFLALMAFALASAAVGNTAIEKAAFYHVHGKAGW